MESLKTLSFEALTVPSPTSGYSVFLAACAEGNLEELSSILSFSPSLLDTLIALETPALERAGPEIADKTPIDIVQELDSPSHKAIQELFQQKAKRMENVNLIHMAARIGSVRHVRILASMGVDLDRTSPHRRDEFSTPLCLAAAYNKTDVIEELVSQGAKIRKRNFKRFNAAHCAAEKGNTKNLLYLLDKDFEMKNSLVSSRVNLLHLAARGGHTDMVEALLKIGLDVNEEVDYDISDDEYEEESYTESFEDYCVELDAEDLSDLDIFSGNATPLMLAARSGNVKTLELLISKGATIQARDLHNRSALFYSCSGGHLLTTKFLIRNGLDVNCCDNSHSTLLHVITDVETTEMLVSEYGLKVAACDAIKRTPLHYASVRGDVKMAKCLIQCGAQVNAVDQYGENPLITALFHHQFKNPEVVSLLLKYGSSLDIGLYFSRVSNDMAIISPGVARLMVELGNSINAKVQGTTLLHLAAGSSFETVTFLVKSGADVNVRDDNGKLPLHIAAQEGQVDIIQFLLEQGSNVDYLDDTGSTPLLLAAANRNPEASLLLLKHSENLCVMNQNLDTLLHVGARNSQLELVQSLLNFDTHKKQMCVSNREKETFLRSYLQKRNKSGSTALENAVQAIDTEIVEVLLACGSDVTGRNEEGRTPLHLAALRGSVKTMELLIKYGSDLNAVDLENRTALHCAVFSGVFEAVSFVVRHGSSESINKSDFCEGATPLECAMMLGLNDELVMKLIPLFLKNGWDILTTNNSGRTALHVAANRVWDNDQNDECVTSVLKLLMEAGSDITATDDEGNTALHLAAQINARNCLEIIEFESNPKKGCPSADENPKPISMHIRNAKGRTPLHETAATVFCDHENVIELLLARGCDIQATDHNGLTPLHIAAAHRNLDVARILVENGADVNIVDKDGNTPLHVAASMHFQGHFDFLVEHGADVNKRNKKGVRARIGEMGDAR